MSYYEKNLEFRKEEGKWDKNKIVLEVERKERSLRCQLSLRVRVPFSSVLLTLCLLLPLNQLFFPIRDQRFYNGGKILGRF